MATIAKKHEMMPASALKPRAARMPFWLQVTTLTWRTLVVNFRVPAAVLPSIVISAFFLLVYQATLGDAAAFLPGLSGKSYLGFILPLSIVSSALSGAGVAGQSIVRDIENGYFSKLQLTPMSRWALLLGPMLGGAIVLVIQTLAVLSMGLLLGLQSATGIWGILGVVGYALLLGVGFSGFTVGIALMSGSAAATSGASFAFFPLSFLTATFVPLNLLSGWIKVAATYNPITYILDAMRALLLNKSPSLEVLTGGLLACAVLGVSLFAFALWSLGVRTRRR